MKHLIVFPHQLFDELSFLKEFDKISLVEESLFFKQFPFHKAKLAFHRATMKNYEAWLLSNGIIVEYINCTSSESDIRILIEHLTVDVLHFWESHDDWLQQRIENTSQVFKKKTFYHQSPYFINSEKEIRDYFNTKKRYLQNDFYIAQRKKRSILMDGVAPAGGQWNFDKDNRLKYPKNKIAPSLNACDSEEEIRYKEEAKRYIETNFPTNPGEITNRLPYPISTSAARKWLVQFIQSRFSEFGPYEDAMVSNEIVLHHSVLTPMLNIGLLTTEEIIEAILKQAPNTALPTLEGFIRQLIGWREFIRGIYLIKGRKERTCNYWKFKRKIPKSFWEGHTGIPPIDITIKKILETGYCHHIERLMLLGNFMLLCEFDPDEVYHWFMSLFIDAYDWVMVPNVYGMSQFADGGIMATKPYISGSNYVRKMSDFQSGEWTEIWDALFWNFMDKQRSFFASNPRLSMLLGTLDKMSTEKREGHLVKAENYLNSLDSQEKYRL